MVSPKRTGGAINGFIEGSQLGDREHVGPLSSKGAGGAINGFIEGNREHHTHSWICVAFHL